LNSGVNDRRARGFLRSVVSMMDILPGAAPPMAGVRQNGSGPEARLLGFARRAAEKTLRRRLRMWAHTPLYRPLSLSTCTVPTPVACMPYTPRGPPGTSLAGRTASPHHYHNRQPSAKPGPPQRFTNRHLVPMVTHRFPLGSVVEAIETVTNREAIKVAVLPGG
jgi:hypothetical protein